MMIEEEEPPALPFIVWYVRCTGCLRVFTVPVTEDWPYQDDRCPFCDEWHARSFRWLDVPQMENDDLRDYDDFEPMGYSDGHECFKP